MPPPKSWQPDHDDLSQLTDIRLWRYGRDTPSLRATVRRRAAIDLWRAEKPTLPLSDSFPNIEQPSLYEGVVAVFEVTSSDLHSLTPAAERLILTYDQYPYAVATFMEAATLRVLGYHVPVALRQRLARHRKAIGLALDLRRL